MSCVWKSQDLLGPPVGPIGPEDSRTLSSALEAEAEHKRKESALIDPSYTSMLTGTSKSTSPVNIQSSSPFFGGMSSRPEDLLARLQDACLSGGAIPDFSFAPRPAATPSFAVSKTNYSNSSQDSGAIFSLKDDLSRTSLSPSTDLSHSGSLRASTGNVNFNKPTSHRRTRSHFYTTGESPIFSTGNELEDDDESSDEEAPAASTSDDTFDEASTPTFTINTIVSKGQIPAVKANMPIPKKVHPTTAELPESPPSQSSMASAVASNRDRVSTEPQLAEKPRHQCNSRRQDSAAVSSAPKAQGPPEPPFSLESLLSSPFTANSLDAFNDMREREWKDLSLKEDDLRENPERFSGCGCALYNQHKNRYPNVLALDSTRVHLSSTGDEDCDYINANYVRGAGEDVYISAQAPIPSTFGDFWRMIWEQKVHVIVMLTRLIEGGFPKAHKYWPVSKSRVYGGKFKVTLVDAVESDYDYRIKEFELECEGERRRIFQFHFKGWPDHGVPTSPDSLLRMSRSIDTHLADLKERPFVEGPSPRAIGPSRSVGHYLATVSEGRSSLASSCSGSITSNSERRSLEEPEPVQTAQPHPFGIARRSSSSQFAVSSGFGSPVAPTSSSSPVSHTRHESTGTFVPTSDSLLSATLANPSSRSASQLTRGSRPHILNAGSAGGNLGSPTSALQQTSVSTSAVTPPSMIGYGVDALRGADVAHAQDLSPPSMREFRSASPTSSPLSDAWLGSSTSSSATASSLRSTGSSLASTASANSSLASATMSASSSTSHLSVPSSHPFAPPHAASPMAGLGSYSSTSTPTSANDSHGVPIPVPDRTGEHKVGPMLVHCSAGIGRSGAFIIIHSVIERILSSGQLNGDFSLYNLLSKLREARQGLVPHQNQYDFCYAAIEHALQVKRIERDIALGAPNHLLHLNGKTRQALQKPSLNRSSHVVPYISNDPPF